MHKKHTLTLLAVMLMPATAMAASLQADDSIAGMGTDIDVFELQPRKQYTLIVTPPLGNEVEIQFNSDSSGNAHVQIDGRDTEISGIYSANIEYGGNITASTNFEILTDTTHNAGSSISSNKTNISPNGKDTANVKVILRDRYGNPISNRPVRLISNRSSDKIEFITDITDESGKQEFAVRSTENGEIILRVMDLLSGEMLATETSISVGNIAIGGNDGYQTTNNRFFGPGQNSQTNSPSYTSALRAQAQFAVVDHFTITAPSELRVNEDATIRITAVDINGNRVEDYTGTVLLSSTDPSAFLPIGGVIPFRAQDFGEKQLTLGLRFRSPDQHYLHAEDSENSNIFGETSIKVGSGSPGENEIKMIQIKSPKDKELINNPIFIIEGTSEPFVNLYVTGGKERITGDTDLNGNFSMEIELDSTITDHIVRVQDDSGYLDSGNIQLKLDMQPPEIGKINFLPEEPEEETDVLLVAEILSDDISNVYVELQDETFNLEQVKDQPEKYQTLIKVSSAGINEATIHAIDIAENESTKSIQLISKLRGLPKVTGVTANTEDNTVTLQWKAITGENIEAYRIYVGESPEEYLFSLDTNYATTAAQVAGLKPGTEYYFTVTAIQGERESREKSDVIKATIQGLRLEVAGEKNSLALDWSNMSSTTPLSSFILEYGVEPNTYTEKRILNGNARHTILRDLLNGVTYFIKISPVSIKGTIIEEMIAEGEGTPLTTAAGFEPTNADSVPFEIGYTQQGNVTPPPNLHQAAPNTTSTGLPNFVVWILIFVSGIIFIIWRKRRKNASEALAFLQTMDSRYRQ